MWNECSCQVNFEEGEEMWQIKKLQYCSLPLLSSFIFLAIMYDGMVEKASARNSQWQKMD